MLRHLAGKISAHYTSSKIRKTQTLFRPDQGPHTVLISLYVGFYTFTSVFSLNRQIVSSIAPLWERHYQVYSFRCELQPFINLREGCTQMIFHCTDNIFRLFSVIELYLVFNNGTTPDLRENYKDQFCNKISLQQLRFLLNYWKKISIFRQFTVFTSRSKKVKYGKGGL